MNNVMRVFFVAASSLVAHVAVLATEVSASSKAMPTPAYKTTAALKAVPAAYKRGVMSTRKTSLGVRVFYEYVGAGVDAAGLLTLKIMRLGGGEAATLELRPDAAISLPTGLPQTLAPFNPGDEYVVKVKPTEDGLHYINVFLRAGNMSEALAIPVQVGKNANLKKAGNVSTMPDGKRVISVPAQ
ncbi:MAG: hypothetical protein ACKOF9_09465 [Burkholderiales bacterium]